MGFKRNTRLVRTVILASILFLLFLASSAQAAYLFQVPEMKMQAFIQPDASAKIVYDITFKNLGQPIDIVDIGMPHSNYKISNMSASINGRKLTDIRKSEFVTPGVEVHLSSETIPNGQTGTLHFEFTMPDMVYQDTTRKDYASFRITPTWFGQQYVSGSGKNQLAVHMLEGVKPEEVLYQNAAFTDKVIYQGRVVAVWTWEAPLTGPHLVGVSFSKQGMTRVVTMTKWKLFVMWFESSTKVRALWGIIYLVALGWLFFRFSGGTGYVVYFVLAGISLMLFSGSATIQIFSVPAIIPIIFLNERYLRGRRSRHKYLPPIAESGGQGIKRGLTAPEAAILLEQPLGKVLSLVVFGLLKKGVVTTLADNPLTVRVENDFNPDTDDPDQLTAVRRKAARKRGIILHAYEGPFIDALIFLKQEPVAKGDFALPMEELISQTAGKLKGFDFEQTKEYYQSIVQKALQRAAVLGDIPAREKYLDKNFEWILFQDDPRPVFHSRGYYYRPIWMRGPVMTGGGGGGIPDVSAPGAAPSFGDVAGSYAGWAENTMSQMADVVAPGALSLPKIDGGVLNLSGVDSVTKDVFQAIASSSGGGGGGGGCACAGCACACACAGGGR